MNYLSRIIKYLFLPIALLFSFPRITFAKEWSECMTTLTNTAGDPIAEVPTLQCFEVVFEKILNVAVGFAVVVLFLFLVIGGFKFLTSGGDPKATESAKNTLTYAILGLALLVGIWFILLFIEKLTGIKVTIFQIGE